MNLNDYEPVPFQYNVFVSYSDNDRDWILENLLPNLESWNDLKVCLHERDFQVSFPQKHFKTQKKHCKINHPSDDFRLA